VEITDGFDFLGFNIRLYDLTPHRPRETKRWKLLIKPSDEAAKRVKAKLREIWRKGPGNRLPDLITNLNRVIRGWANYYRRVVSTETFKALDDWMWTQAWRFARHRHKDKSRRWCFKSTSGSSTRSTTTTRYSGTSRQEPTS
jgi:RNA-directed DNA polymerase